MQGPQLTSLTGIVLGLQFAAFGWRVNREISVAEANRRTWLPLPDAVNIASLLSVVTFGVVVPLAQGDYILWSRRVLAGAATLIAFHPLTMAAHYGIPYRRARPRAKDGDFQYAPIEEILTLGVSLVLAGVAVSLVKL
jgi:hypothetical protein